MAMAGPGEKMDLVAEFSRFETEMNGSRGSSTHTLRKRALDAVIQQGIPTTGVEEWKYTNLQYLDRSKFHIAPQRDLSSSELENLRIPQLGGNTLFFVNGFFAPKLSHLAETDDLTITSLASFLKQSDAGELRALFDRGAARYAEAGNVFPALNTAFARDGVVIRVTRGAQVLEPVHIVHVAAVSDETQKGICPRHLFVVEENASVTIVESFHSASENTSVTVHLSQLELSQGARCTHVKLQQERSDSSHISYIDASVGKDAHFNQLLCTVGGGVVRNEIRPIVSGSGSECFLRGLTVIGGKQHVDNSTTIDHAVPHAQSTEIYKGVFAGEATSAFSGTIIVRKDAQKTNAIQSNDSILLSDRATINTRPQLKIWADDVKCTHGATVGQLQGDALHYLRARGIPYPVARQMLIEAFAGEVISSIEHSGVQSWIDEILKDKLQEVLKDT